MPQEEKLIEEIADWIWNDPDDIEARREDALQVITRTTQAIIEGELDEWLKEHMGLVGRRKIRHIDHEYIDDQRLKKGDVIIAFRPPTGDSQEEEK